MYIEFVIINLFTHTNYSLSLAAVNMVPGSLGCGSAVLAAITILAPS